MTVSAAILLVGLAAPESAGTTSGITGSPHDMTDRRPGAAAQICTFCHIPELTDPPGPTLWVSHDAGNGRFTTFGDPGSGDPAAFKPLGTSLVCLSCHDGTIAWDTLAIPGTSASARRRGGDVPVGAGGLANNHPVSISYGESYDATFNTPIGGKVGDLPLFRASGTRGAGDRVECPSCHNPHEIVFGKFLRVANRDGALCRNCHDK